MRPSEYLHKIASSTGAVATHVSELVTAEVKPAVKGAAAGSGLVAGAGFLGYTALKIFGIALAFLFAWVFSSVAGLSAFMSLFLGFCVLGVLTLLLVAVAGLWGKRQFKKVKAPTAAFEEIKATVGALGPAVADGIKDAEDALIASKLAKEAAEFKAKPVRDPIWTMRR